MNYKRMLSFDRDIFNVFFCVLAEPLVCINRCNIFVTICWGCLFRLPGKRFSIICLATFFPGSYGQDSWPDFAAFVWKIPVPVSSFRQPRIKRRKSSAQDRPFHEWKRMNGLCRRPFRLHRAGQGKKGMSGKHFLQDGVFRK